MVKTMRFPNDKISMIKNAKPYVKKMLHPARLPKIIKKAEEVAKKHGGTLPPPRDLCHMGCSDIVCAIYNFPKHFRHIKQKRLRERRHPPQYYVEMAKKIAGDGEGATKLVEVTVKNAKTKADAKLISKKIICSNLVKCAMYGNDPNWGRIICAAGNSGGYFVENRLDIFMQGKKIVSNGVEVKNFDAKSISKSLKADIVKVVLDLHLGKEQATAYGCDMSYDYVTINAEYHT